MTRIAVRELSAADAKARFAECLRFAEDGEAIVITRYGKSIAALVPAHELERLLRLRRATPEDGLSGLVGRFDDMDDFVEGVLSTAADRPPPRVGPGIE